MTAFDKIAAGLRDAIAIAEAHRRVMAKYPKVMERLRQSELEDARRGRK